MCADPDLLRYHPDDIGRVRERMVVLRRGEEEVPAEQYRLMRADGTPIWMEVVANLVAGSQVAGGVQRFVACFRDVSARRAAEQGMADANRRLESVLNNSPAVLYELELRLLPDGSYEVLRQFVSRSAARSSDFTIEELERPGFIASRSSPNFKELRQHSIRMAMEEGKATIEYPFREKSGAERHMRDTCTLTSHEGDRVVLTGFSLDVTEEASLRDQLLETSKLSFLGEMAAGIAHELHQPLTAINLQAEILAIEVPEGSPGKAAVDRRVEKITALVERAGAVIRRIRAFSRRNTEPAAPFDPSAAIEDGLAIIEGRIAEGEVTITRDYPATAVAVLGHEAPFEQVIMNLVSNAIDAYGPPGSEPASSRQIGVRVAPMGPVIEITVADRAGGIPAEIMSRLFEPFFTTKGVGVGTGLGLSISYRIVSDMGGHIRAVNRDGGALFTVTLPAHTPAAVA